MKGRDPAAQLVRALLRDAPGQAVLCHDGQKPWASATFVGAQHRVSVIGDGLETWLNMLGETDLLMRGCFVASLDVARHDGGATLTVLVLHA